ncbi:hypothetical protein KY495_04430 [Massilia sp. PAMC28688]|uniref:hypothetical protein n=1 Tax=Massilia sp. PAMC28688 TaxID=2861283 RepID=UPI001C63497C|nr:hypothetical protein [Massilia sp. PAMC28688]QYF94469.1 hypothetical protein KY495_04430 [Massilia sp. PAMC28688]
MLRTSTMWKLLSLCLLAPAGVAVAQQQPSPTPPKLEVLEDAPNTKDGRITVTPPPKQPATRITEKKEGGRVTEVTVKSGKSEYTMKPNIPAGNAQPGDAQSSAIRAPQWTILEFDLNKRKKAEAEATVDAPPPETTTPAKAKK